jgi:hypothetical protein
MRTGCRLVDEILGFYLWKERMKVCLFQQPSLRSRAHLLWCDKFAKDLKNDEMSDFILEDLRFGEFKCDLDSD